MLSTRIKKWEQEIAEKGLKKGLEKGREEGMQKGEAYLLSRQLELKFGALPQWVEDKIAAADKNTLENWGLRLITADTLNKVFE